MAIIQNQNLTFVPLPGGKFGAVVTYQIAWQGGDTGAFFHSVSLRGSDPVVEDDLAPMSPSPGWQLGAPFTITPVIAITVVERDKLDEDRDYNLGFLALRNKDEIYARITLMPLSGGQMQVDTNKVEADFGA
jgi:hypothetical protein